MKIFILVPKYNIICEKYIFNSLLIIKNFRKNLHIGALKRINSYQPIKEEELSNLVKWIDSEKGSPINLTQALLSSIYTIVSRSAFGKKYKDQENFISVVKKSIKVAGGFNIGDLFPSATWLQRVTGLRPKLERLHQQTDHIMENIIMNIKRQSQKPKITKGKQKILWMFSYNMRMLASKIFI